MIIFNKNDLKEYLKKKTGYEVSSIHSICTDVVDFNSNIPDDMVLKINNNEGTIIKVSAFCDAQKTPGFKDYTIKTFLWTENIKIQNFIKFIRLKKLHKINKSII